VTLEARLDPGRLRIRVWPDAISVPPRLTPRETEAAQQYWRGRAATSEAEAAWRALAAVPAGRAQPGRPSG
jgi:hypothetical protein